MRRLAAPAAALGALLVGAVLAIGAPPAGRALAETPVAAPAPTATPTGTSAPPACVGAATVDARTPGCGLTVGRVPVVFTWSHEATPIATALAAPRLAFRGAPPAEPATPIQAVTIWHADPATGAWQSWSATPTGPFATLRDFVRGGSYTITATTDVDLSLAPVRPSLFTGTRVVSLYGFPGVPTMGRLGEYPSAEAAAAGVDELVARYAAVSGGRRVVGALHLIVAVAQADAGWDGTYLGRMSIEAIREYVEVTRAHGQLLFLDVQVGWGDPLTEVQRLAPLLAEPHVHLALDPEFATRGKNEPPGEAIGYLTPEQVNAVQRDLVAVAARAGVPAKVLVLHQFRYDMLRDPQRIERVDGVDLVVDMDGWGGPEQKLDGYRLFALSSYAEYAAFKLFFRWDDPLLTPEQVMALPRPPDYVIYQ